MLVLVRLLPAEVYGQFGFLTAVLSFLTLYSFREFLAYTLVVRDDAALQYQSQFTAGAVIQAGICLLANVVALGLARLPDYASVSPVLHVMSISFLLDLPSEFRVKMLERELNWRRLRVLHGVALAAGAVLSLAMAWAGAGVYALIVPTMTVHVVFAWDLFVRAGFRPTWQWSAVQFRPAWQFGTTRIAAGTASSAGGLLEASWLGAVGFASFGIFGRAVGLGQLLCGRLAGLLSQAVFPVLARIPHGSDSYRQASALFLRAVIWLVVPLAIVAAWLAEPIVLLLYGDAWAGVVPLMPWVMAGAAVLAAVQTGYVLLLAHHGQGKCLAADVWRFAGTAAALAILAGGGLRPYLAGLAAVHLVTLVLVFYWLAREQAISARGLVDACWPAGAAALAGVALSELAAQVIAGDAVDGRLAASAVFVVTYLTVLRLAFGPQMSDLVRLLPEPDRLTRWLRLQGARA